MTLTPEIMKTDPRGNSFNGGAMRHDITHMDQPQLDRYVRATFLGRSDPAFLPGPFWETHYNSSSLGPSDGHAAPSPAHLFADTYVALGSMQRRGEVAFKVRNGQETIEYPADFEYRGRLRNSLGGILDESISGEPTKVHLRLGLFAYEAVDAIAMQDGPNSFVQQFAARLEEKGTMNMGEVGEMASQIKPQTAPELDELIKKAQSLMANPAYQELYGRINAVYGNLYQIPELDTSE